MTQDNVYACGDMMLLKEAVEAAKSADRAKVAAALRAMVCLPHAVTCSQRVFSGCAASL
jgi:ribosomal protein S19